MGKKQYTEHNKNTASLASPPIYKRILGDVLVWVCAQSRKSRHHNVHQHSRPGSPVRWPFQCVTVCICTNNTSGGCCCVLLCVMNDRIYSSMCVCVCMLAHTCVCVCVFMHLQRVSQVKPAVYHSSLPCVASKLHHAWLWLFMTQSQEGHMCLCWGSCYKIWTHIKNDHSPPYTNTFFFSKGYHVRKFLSGGLGSKKDSVEISVDSRWQMSVQASVLKASKQGKLLWKLSGRREFYVFALGLSFSLFHLGKFRTVMTWERLAQTKERIKETGCIKYGGQRAGVGGGCIST